MPEAAAAAAEDANPEDVLPDFCQEPLILRLAVIMALVAIVITLAGDASEAFARRLLLVMLYLQCAALCCAAALCYVRRWLHHAPLATLFPACWMILVLVILAISAVGYEIVGALHEQLGFAPEPRKDFLIRHVSIGALVALMVLQFFWLHHRWRQQVRAEADARYQALQARIRPHMLFNSLNSIAALVGSKPGAAEDAIEDLSELLRASLDVRGRLVPLSSELSVVKAYLRIEQLRLGERLQVAYDVPDEALAIELPFLSVQPLVENAVYHGVEPLREAATVTLRAFRSGTDLVVDVCNPRPPDGAPVRTGHRMALDNITQRLAHIYGGSASVQLSAEPDGIRARLTVPVVAPHPPG